MSILFIKVFVTASVIVFALFKEKCQQKKSRGIIAVSNFLTSFLLTETLCGV